MQSFKVLEKEFCIDDAEMLCDYFAKASSSCERCALLTNEDGQIMGVTFSSRERSCDILFGRGEARVISKERMTD